MPDPKMCCISHRASKVWERICVKRFKCWKGGGTSEKHRRTEIQETPKTKAKNHCPTLVPWLNSLIKPTIFYKSVYQKPHPTGCSLLDTFSLAGLQPSPYSPKRIITDLSRTEGQKFIWSGWRLTERGPRWSSTAHTTLLLEPFGNHGIIKVGKHL